MLISFLGLACVYCMIVVLVIFALLFPYSTSLQRCDVFNLAGKAFPSVLHTMEEPFAILTPP